jgi:hypothetical protein
MKRPRIHIRLGGLRLDEVPSGLQTAIHAILHASFSPTGYSKTLACCLTNDFLGELVNGKAVLNQHSYNFRLFPPQFPSSQSYPAASAYLTQPWGYSFFGHHLCINIAFLGTRMVIGPTFMGAEPDQIDVGPYAGLRLFLNEELGALKLMQSLPADLQAKATVSKGMDGTSLPEDRWNPFDERHLGGARQDNRVVPYEGCPVSLFPEDLQENIVELYKTFNEYYPDSVLEHRIRNFRKYLPETYFAWIGEFGDEDPYYYRIHSPVAFCELDFHCGST